MKKILKGFVPLFVAVLLGITSCNSENDRDLSRSPASMEMDIAVEEEASAIIRDYGRRINSLNAEIDKPKIQELKSMHDQAVIQLEKYGQAADIDKELRRQELEDIINKLEKNWDDYVDKN